MSDDSTSRRRQQLLDKYLAREIDKATYDALLAELREASSASGISRVPINDVSLPSPEFQVETTYPPPNDEALARATVVGPGVDVGGFRIERRLGRGGMGEVWQAHDVIGDRSVVIKFLHHEFIHHPEEMSSVKEVFRLVHDLQHQNICPLYLLGQDRRFGYYVVMKYIDGLTLAIYRRKFIERRLPFPVPELVRILGAVAKALDYAHGKRIIHCDVKPQNIMIGRDGHNVQLVDFGLAAEIRSSVARLSSSSVDYGGTHPYMSPEQWRGETLDGKTDQYALAVVAYELLAGRRPFQSSDPTVLRACALNELPGEIAGVDSTVNAAILRGLSKSKSDRFQSCAAFVKAIAMSVDVVATQNESLFEQSTIPGIPFSNLPSTGPITDHDEELVDISGIVTWPESQKGGLGGKATPHNLPLVRRSNVSEDDSDSPIARANRQAVVWVGAVGLASAVLFISVTMWLVNSVMRSSAESRTAEPTSIAKTADQPVSKPKPVDNSLRYRWQPNCGYLYSVNLDIDRDPDRVVTLSGELMYSVLTPAADPVPDDRESTGTGTAFVVHPDGYLLTCHHVTEGATKIEVALAGKTYQATLVSDDIDHDLALIRIDARELSCLTIADSDTVQQGEEVRAIGFPLSSLLGENIKATRGTIAGINEDDGRKVFQIDAAINPGNSGGPLVNEKAEVVGVIYAKLVEEFGTSVGFATPVNDAKLLLEGQKISIERNVKSIKLDGPALVKEVSLATALVTVTSVGKSRSPRGRISLGCDGTLNPKSWRRSGQPGEPIDPLAQQLVFSSVGTGADVDKVETDSLGRIHSATSHGSLPSFLGQAAQLIVERLPSARKHDWSYSQKLMFRVKQEGNSSRLGPRGPRFGMVPFGPPMGIRGPFGPPGFGGQPQETMKEFSGSMRVDYALGEQTDNLLTVQKSMEMKSDELVGGNPRIQMTGKGDFVMNTLTGLPQELVFSAELVQNEPNRTTKVPIKLTYKLLEERKRPPFAGQPNTVPLPVTSPGNPVEDAKLDVGSKLVGEWAGKWLPVKVMSMNDDGTVRIHWEGWSDQWDEDVIRSRLRYPPK